MVNETLDIVSNLDLSFKIANMKHIPAVNLDVADRKLYILKEAIEPGKIKKERFMALDGMVRSTVEVISKGCYCCSWECKCRQ